MIEILDLSDGDFKITVTVTENLKKIDEKIGFYTNKQTFQN